jgi:hypothetical protein
VRVGCRSMILWFAAWLLLSAAAALWLSSTLPLLLIVVGLVPLVFLFAFKPRPPVCPRCGGPMQTRALGALVPGLVCPKCGHVEARTKLEG